MSSEHTARPDTRLTGRWLVLARGVWVVVVALAVGYFLLSIPFQLAYYQITCSGSACPGDQISPANVEQLRQAGLSLAFYARYFTTLNALVALTFALIGAVIFWRKSSDWMGIFTSLTLVLFGIIFNSSPFSLVGQQYPSLLLLSSLLTFVGSACFFIFFYLFPTGRLAPRWIVWLVPFVVVHEALSAFRPDLVVFANDWFFPVEVASAMFAQIYRFWRVSNTLQRQQTKWVVFGSALGGGGFLGLILLSLVTGPGAGSTPPSVASDLFYNTAFDVFIVLIPISIGIAILRSRLWDIDLLIRRTLLYAALTGLLALVYFGSVLVLENVVRGLTGRNQSQVVTVISTLVIAALFVPLRRGVQAFIDRRFYRRKYDAARTLAAFSNTVRDEVDLGRLTDHLTDVVDETLQPETLSLWLRAPSGERQRP